MPILATAMDPEDRSSGILGGWYCDGCDLAVHEHEVLREPIAGDVETMLAREFRGTGRSELRSLNYRRSPALRTILAIPTLCRLTALNRRSSRQPLDPRVASDNRDEAVNQLATVIPQTRQAAQTLERRWDETGRSFNRRAAPSKAPSRPVLLMIAAVALSALGIAINGSFARSLGSTDFAGLLFLAVGVAADLAALVLPSTAAGYGRPASG